MERKLKYSPLENGYVPFNVYEGVEPGKKERDILDLPLNSIQMPEGWYVEDGIPVTRGKQYQKQEDEEIMINTNNPEIQFIPSETQSKQKAITPIKSESQATQFAMKYFINKGLKPHQAAGLVGNLLRESQLNPKALNGASGAIGIAQWLGDRKRKLISLYGKNPTFEQQLDFVWNELNSTHKRGLYELQHSNTVEDAAANAFGWFEFSVGPQGAVQDMIKHGQDGEKSLIQGIRFAKGIQI